MHHWAFLILALIRLKDVVFPSDSLETLRAHAASAERIDSVRGTVTECSVSRAFQCNSWILRFAVEPSLDCVPRAVIQCLVTLGGNLKLGAPPRAPPARALMQAMSTAGIRHFVPR